MLCNKGKARRFLKFELDANIYCLAALIYECLAYVHMMQIPNNLFQLISYRSKFLNY